MGPLAVNGALYPDMSFDASSFAPIVLIERAPLVLVARADKPYKSVAEVVAAAEAKPGTIAVGNAGTGGGTPREFGEFIAKEADRWPRLVKAAGIKVE